MKLSIEQGDITTYAVDAIVNAANCSLLGGGGVDGAIHRAAGKQLLAECRTLHGCETGKAKITKGYQLPAKYVVHTPGPIWRGGNHNEAQLLANSYRNSLAVAWEHGCRTVAFPSISTGVYHFPLEQAADIAVQTIAQFLQMHPDMERVTMVCFDRATYQAYERAVKRLCTLFFMFLWGVTVLGCVMIFVMLFYKLDKEYPQIMKELLERESKKAEK